MQYKDKLFTGDSLPILSNIEDDSVDLVITSPPYFQQRDYGNDHVDIGSEKTEEEYLNNLLQVFFECVRVTKPTGTVVYNLGDKYVNGGLCLIPYKFALEAINSKKVFLINELTWSKLNPTPRQDKKKLVQTTEPFFIFAKSKDYCFNLDNYLQHFDELNKRNNGNTNIKIGQKYFYLIDKSDLNEQEKNEAKKELYKTIELVKSDQIHSFRMKIRGLHKLPYGGQAGGRNDQINQNGFTIIKITGNKLKKDIIESPVEAAKNNSHPAVYPQYIIQELIKLLTKQNDVVLDPFNGSGTTCIAAKKLNRHYIGIDINPKYIELAKERIEKANPNIELFI